jgi:hypothetical protein
MPVILAHLLLKAQSSTGRPPEMVTMGSRVTVAYSERDTIPIRIRYIDIPD